MTTPLSPRDIQTRIRSGTSLEELAREADVPVEKIEPYAAPVLAEREHVAGTALQCPVRRRGETGSVRAMRAVVTEKLAGRSIAVDDVEWDAWRNEDRRWTVVGRYQSGDEQHEALFVFDQRARFSVATNDEARWLIGEHTAAPGPAPMGSMDSPDAEPTIDLNDELALIRAIQGAGGSTDPLPESSPSPRPEASGPTQGIVGSAPRAQREPAHEQPTSPVAADRLRPAETASQRVVVRETTIPAPGQSEVELEVQDYAPAELEQVDGVYDIVPSSTNDMDVLYEMLSSFAEDSVNIYAGLANPVTSTAGGHQDEVSSSTRSQPGEAEPAPELEEESTRPMRIHTSDTSAAVAPPPAEEDLDTAADPVVAADEDAEPTPTEQAWSSFTTSVGVPAHFDDEQVPPSSTASSHEAPLNEPVPAKQGTDVAAADVSSPAEIAARAAVAESVALESAAASQNEQTTEPAPVTTAATPARTTKPRPRKKRAAVPSWDEIMFGGSTPGTN